MGTILRGGVVVCVLAVAGGLYYWLSSDGVPQKTITPEPVAPVEDVVEEVIEEEGYVKSADASPITGLPCENYDKRPLAIMYSGDVETRPYFSGIAEAGFVVEMDHRYTHGGTRVMGIYDCIRPEFVGPMRSGRVDFLNVAASFDAIYVPWGGDSVSKSLLKRGVHDHIDCNSEVYPGGSQASCFRRQASVVPLAGEDRAFSSAVELARQAQGHGYDMAMSFDGYEHVGDAPIVDRPADGTLSIAYSSQFAVRYEYNPSQNSYERFFAGRAEYDFNTKKRVAPKNVIVITSAKGTFPAGGLGGGKVDPWAGVDAQHRSNDAGQYPNFALGDPWFDSVRSGEAAFYFDGQKVIGKWSKGSDVHDPFVFTKSDGAPVNFVPGQIWLHVMDVGRTHSWETSS